MISRQYVDGLEQRLAELEAELEKLQVFSQAILEERANNIRRIVELEAKLEKRNHPGPDPVERHGAG